MATTGIEYGQVAWNPVTGCSPVSEGCQNCWAKPMAKRQAGRNGYPVDHPFKVTLHPDRLIEPLKRTKPRMVLVSFMGDLFHDEVNEKYIAKVFGIMDLSRQHTFLVLTKRPERAQNLLNDEDFQFHIGWFQSQAIREFGLPDPGDNIGPFPFKNVWLGVTAENQARADERIPILLQIPAAKRFVSIEPMLGPVDIMQYLLPQVYTPPYPDRPALDWAICGGESGPGARQLHPDWARSLRYQCVASGTPFYFKQWGEYVAISQMTPDTYRAWDCQHGTEVGWKEDEPRWKAGKKNAGRLLDGREWLQMPEVVS